MDIRQLRNFVAIMQEGSISGAAVRLGVAQPSVSQQLKQLEAELGLPLFVRAHNGVIPTDAADTLFGHARSILDAVDLAESDMRDRTADPRGLVTVGLPSAVSMILSVPLAETVRHQLPNVTLRVVEAMSGHVKTWLEDGTVDLGITYGDPVKDAVAQPLILENLYFVAPPDNAPLDVCARVPGEAAITFAACIRLPLILPGRSHSLRELIERNARALGLDLNVVIEMDALAQIKSLVSRGSGYTILAEPAVLAEVARGELNTYRVYDPELTRTSYVVRKMNVRVTRAVHEVERLIVDILREVIHKKRMRGTFVGADVTIDRG